MWGSYTQEGTLLMARYISPVYLLLEAPFEGLQVILHNGVPFKVAIMIIDPEKHCARHLQSTTNQVSINQMSANQLTNQSNEIRNNNNKIISAYCKIQTTVFFSALLARLRKIFTLSLNRLSRNQFSS